MKLASLFVLSLGVLGVAACDSPGFKSKAKSAVDAKAAAQPVGQATTTSAGIPGQGDAISGALGAQTPVVFTPGLSVSDAIARACGIAPRGETKEGAAAGAGPGTVSAPRFDFDSAALGEDDRKLLADVARCLTDGPLRGRRVALIGRADARGEAEYNMTLGESRADSVRRYLVDLGVGKDKMNATSRGEMDATGSDEEGFKRDRRVDLELLD